MRWRFKGLDKYVKKLENLSNPWNAQVCVENAVTAGSEVAGDITKAELSNLPVDNKKWATEGNKRHGVRSIEKKELIASFGITPLEIKNNHVNRKTGVDRGYLSTGTPYVVLARSVETGTSFMDKNPVFSRGTRKARKPCLDAMQQSLTDDINRIMDGNQARLQRRELKNG